jgi:hypothetical protein
LEPLSATIVARAGRTATRRVSMLGAIFNLDQPAHYVHWHFFQMSVANLLVVVLMIVVFVLAIALPFPTRNRET